MFPRTRFHETTCGTINVGKGTVFCGPDSYVVMYSVEKGSLMNMVSIKHISPTAPGSELAALRH